jgi:hypothetical protein
LPLEITTALICDDVRRESNGKEFLIGVLGNRIFLPSFPMTLNFTVWMRAKFRRSGPAKIEVRLINNLGQAILPVVTTEVSSPPEIDDESTIILGGAPFQLHGPAHIKFQWRPVGGQWEEIVGIKIEQGGPDKIGRAVILHASTVSAQPSSQSPAGARR